MLHINYSNGITTEHDNVVDALFVMRNIVNLYRTTVKNVIAENEEDIKELRCTALLINGKNDNKKYAFNFSD
jgi:hypothetical protein